MGALIDTSIFIGAEKGDCDLWGRLEQHPGEEVALAAVSASELLHGVHRAWSAQRAKREAFVEKILGTISVLPFDLTVARVHARLWADLAARGVGVGERDLLIAATAVTAGHRVITRDERSFPKIPGVDVEVWPRTDKEKIAMRSLLQENLGKRCSLRWRGTIYEDMDLMETLANTATLHSQEHGNLTVRYDNISDVRFHDR